jgi:hypothetical protein
MCFLQQGIPKTVDDSAFLLPPPPPPPSTIANMQRVPEKPFSPPPPSITTAYMQRVPACSNQCLALENDKKCCGQVRCKKNYVVVKKCTIMGQGQLLH